MDLEALLRSSKEADDLRKIKQDWTHIRKVSHQTEEMCRVAIQSSPFSLLHIQNQTKELCEMAINLEGNAIMFVRNQTLDLCMLAVKKAPESYSFMQVDYKEVRDYLRKELGRVPDCRIPTPLWLDTYFV